MTTALVVLAVVWTVTAFLVGVVVGRMIWLRDRQTPAGDE